MENDVFTSKELATMIYELREELTKTTTLIRGYNGLRETQNDFSQRLKSVEKCLENKTENKKDYQWILGWIVGLASLIYAILK